MDDSSSSTKFFLKNLAYFLVFLIVIIMLINQLYFDSVISDKQVYRTEKEFFGILNNESVFFIFTGDSHPKAAINPEYIDNSFNFAVGGDDYQMVFLRFKKLLSDGFTPKVLILEADPHSFNNFIYPDNYQVQNLWFWAEEELVHDVRNIGGYDSLELFFRSKIYFMGEGGNLGFLIGDQGTSMTYRGWLDPGKNFSDVLDRGESARVYFDDTFQNTDEGLNPKGVEYFKKILALAKDNGVRVVVLKYPLTPEYRRVISDEGFNQTEYYDSIMKILEDSGADFLVWDYQSRYSEDGYFSDPGHLNAFGASVFSKELNERLKVLA